MLEFFNIAFKYVISKTIYEHNNYLCSFGFWGGKIQTESLAQFS